MRTSLALLLPLLICACSPAAGQTAESAQTPTPQLTLERLLFGPSLTGSPPSAPSWSPDSRRLAFRWRDRSGSRREVWLVEADGSGLRRLTSDTEGRSGVRELAWMPDGQSLLYLRSGTLRRANLDGTSRVVATLPSGASTLAVSPDGRSASFLRGGDLWLVNISEGAVRRLTRVGQPPLSQVPFGRYRRREVEIGSYIWGGPTYAWAPDSRSIAVHHVDRRAVRKVPFPNYLGEETDPNLVRRSYPGDANEQRRVGLLRVETGALQLLDLPDPEAVRVVGFSWSSEGRLLIDRESDTAVDRWLHVYDPGPGELKGLWHDRRETRVYTTSGSAWHPDGQHVIMLGDLGDRYGLYALSLESPTPRLLTNPSFDVTAPPKVTRSGAIFFESNEPSPYERHVHRVLLDGDASQRLTEAPGSSRPYPSPDGSKLAVLRSDDAHPTELFLRAVGEADPARRITHSVPPHFEQIPWAVARYLTFPSRTDDAVLHARLLLPPKLEKGKRYPVLFGPVYSNTVRNRWGGFHASFQQLLVQKGYLVVQVDVRGSTGYGRKFREDFLVDFAGQDLEDLHSAVNYLETLPFVDPDRIGIWGSSYGGTLTVYALLKKPGLFDAGVAGAAAVDPHFFGGDDVAIVRRPDSHPAAFQRGAAQYAANLEDPLLLIHGMQDQVVPFKTVVDLAEALIRQGKDFDFAFAPAGTHGWTGPRHYARYLLGKLLSHFERHLTPEAPGKDR